MALSGSFGARILVTLLYAMARRNAQRGIAALCLDGNAVAVEKFSDRKIQ